MPQEKMSQEEIDRLIMNSLSPQEMDFSSITSEADQTLLKPKYQTLLTELRRLEFARNALSFEEQKEARYALHCAAFALWLARKGMTRNDYYNLINRELKKRGYPPYFNI
jgi:hypothetical protein